MSKETALKVFEIQYRKLECFNLCILIDYPIHIDIISMGLSISYFRVSHVKYSKL